MEKKFYEAPELEVVDMETEAVLLADSGGKDGGDNFGDVPGEI